MSHTKIPLDELKVFESLTDVKVVFDVGARDDVDYLILKPDIELHAFEPSPTSFEELKATVGDTANVYLNNFALGDVEGTFEYNQAGECIVKQSETGVIVKTLDNYCKEHDIKKIDFLKVDTEGYDSKVLMGAKEMLKNCRYIQYEQNNVGKPFNVFLPDDFDLYYIGYRNVLGVRKGELVPYIPEIPLEGGQGEKDGSNYLR